MVRSRSFYYLLLIGLLAAATVEAQIYQWTDENGQVHFGDKPKDQEQAEKAKPVDVQENYRPSELTEKERQAQQQQREYAEQLRQARQHKATQRSQQQAKQAEARQERCEAKKARLARLTGITQKNGRQRYYYSIEDGKSVSSNRQREIIEQIKREIAREC